MQIRMTRVKTLVAAGTLSVAFVCATAAVVAQTTPPPPQNPPAGQGAKPPALPTTSQPQAPQAPPKPVLPFPADAKVGYVVMQAVVTDSKLGKCGQDRMRTVHDGHERQLIDKNKELQAAQQKAATQAGLVSEQAQTQMQRDVDKIQRDQQQMIQDFQADEKNVNEDLLNNFSTKVGPIVEAVRNERGLWVILAGGPDGFIAAANPALDLSGEITKRLDASDPSPCVLKTGGQ
jgi:Skp family chaperone for outer membrane proteins